MSASQVSFRPYAPRKDDQLVVDFFRRAQASWLARGLAVGTESGYPLLEVQDKGALPAASLTNDPSHRCDWLCFGSDGTLVGMLRTSRRPSGAYPWRLERILFVADHEKALPGTVAVALVLHLRQAHGATAWGFGHHRSAGGAKVMRMMRTILPLKGVEIEPEN